MGTGATTEVALEAEFGLRARRRYLCGLGRRLVAVTPAVNEQVGDHREGVAGAHGPVRLVVARQSVALLMVTKTRGMHTRLVFRKPPELRVLWTPQSTSAAWV